MRHLCLDRIARHKSIKGWFRQALVDVFLRNRKLESTKESAHKSMVGNAEHAFDFRAAVDVGPPRKKPVNAVRSL